MPTILGQLTRATNILGHHLEERIVETGLYVTEYLVLRTAASDPEATTADVRRSLALRHAAFSDVVRRSVARGYARVIPAPRDRRTKLLTLTLPGAQAVRIAEDIHRDLEGYLGAPIRQLEAFEFIQALGGRLSMIPAATLLSDGLPLATA